MHQYRRTLLKAMSAAMPLAIAAGAGLFRSPSALAAVWNLAEQDTTFLTGRYRCPEPRSTLALLVRNFAQGAIDVSDGLVGDVQKLAQVSHVGASIETARVPFSSAARKATTP